MFRVAGTKTGSGIKILDCPTLSILRKRIDRRIDGQMSSDGSLQQLFRKCFQLFPDDHAVNFGIPEQVCAGL
jgi:hypothetical protein